MKSQVTTTPHPEHKPKSDEEKKLMTRTQTPEERTKFINDRNKYNKVDHEESVRAAQDLASRSE